MAGGNLQASMASGWFQSLRITCELEEGPDESTCSSGWPVLDAPGLARGIPAGEGRALADQGGRAGSEPDPGRRLARPGDSELRHPRADQALRRGAPRRGPLRPLLGDAGPAAPAGGHRREARSGGDAVRPGRRDHRHGRVHRGHRRDPPCSHRAGRRSPRGITDLRILSSGDSAGRRRSPVRAAGGGRELRPRPGGHLGRGRPADPGPGALQPEQPDGDGVLGRADPPHAGGRRAREPRRHCGRGLQGLRLRRRAHPQRRDGAVRPRPGDPRLLVL